MSSVKLLIEWFYVSKEILVRNVPNHVSVAITLSFATRSTEPSNERDNGIKEM